MDTAKCAMNHLKYIDSGKVLGYAEGRKTAGGRKTPWKHVNLPKGVNLSDDKDVK